MPLALISIKRHSVSARAFYVGLMQGIANMKMGLLFGYGLARGGRREAKLRFSWSPVLSPVIDIPIIAEAAAAGERRIIGLQVCLRIVTRDDAMGRRSMNISDVRFGRSRRREGGAKSNYGGKRKFCLGERCRVSRLIWLWESYSGAGRSSDGRSATWYVTHQLGQISRHVQGPSRC